MANRPLHSLPRRALAALLSVSLLAAPLPAHTESPLPDLGDESFTVLSPGAERKLGENFMQQARRHLPIIDDPELAYYIQTLGLRLVAHSERPDLDFRFFLIRDGSINAFAVPGGFIGVHTGLLLNARNEGEVASVLAHEIAHVTQRHLPRLIAQSQRTTLPAMAAMLAGLLLARSGQGGEATIAVTTAALGQQQLNYTREYEQEADRLGMKILTGSGFDARAMPSFFDRLMSLTRLYDTNLPEYLRTHPLTTRRIAEAQNQAERYPHQRNEAGRDFLHMQARIRALSPENPATIVQGFRRELEANPGAAGRYGLALVLTRQRQTAEARALLNGLIKELPDYLTYRMALAELELAAGNARQGLALYETLYAKHQSHPALLHRYATALLQQRQFAKAHQLLRAAVRRRPDDPVLQKMLATAAGESGSRVEAHRAMAEHYYLQGDGRAALQQLEIARREAGRDFYLLSGVEARMTEIRDEIALFARQ